MAHKRTAKRENSSINQALLFHLDIEGQKYTEVPPNLHRNKVKLANIYFLITNTSLLVETDLLNYQNLDLISLLLLKIYTYH